MRSLPVQTSPCKVHSFHSTSPPAHALAENRDEAGSGFDELLAQEPFVAFWDFLDLPYEVSQTRVRDIARRVSPWLYRRASPRHVPGMSEATPKNVASRSPLSRRASLRSGRRTRVSRSLGQAVVPPGSSKRGRRDGPDARGPSERYRRNVAYAGSLREAWFSRPGGRSHGRHEGGDTVAPGVP